MHTNDDGAGGVEAGAPTVPSRTRARLAAVQALYQMELTQRDLSQVLDEFVKHGFFRDLASGVAHAQAAVDIVISEQLAEGWRLSRLDSILRAILRSAVYELLERREVPARATINEYVEIAHDFFGGEEPGVVNGVLNRVARKNRRDEFGRKGGGKRSV